MASSRFAQRRQPRARSAASMARVPEPHMGSKRGMEPSYPAKSSRAAAKSSRRGAWPGVQAVAPEMQMGAGGVQADGGPAVRGPHHDQLPAGNHPPGPPGEAPGPARSAGFGPPPGCPGPSARRGAGCRPLRVTDTAKGAPTGRNTSQGMRPAWRARSEAARTRKSAKTQKHPAGGAQPEVGRIGRVQPPRENRPALVGPHPRPGPGRRSSAAQSALQPGPRTTAKNCHSGAQA